MPPFVACLLVSPDKRSRSCDEMARAMSSWTVRTSESLRSYWSPQRLRLVRASISSALMMSWSPRWTMRPVITPSTYNARAAAWGSTSRPL